MKKSSVQLLFVFLLAGFLTHAQEVHLEPIQPDSPSLPDSLPTIEPMSDATLLAKANVYESDESMSKGIQPAIIVEVASSDKKLVESVWKKFMKNYGGKTKRSKGGKNEYTTTGAEVVGINGVNSLTVYSSAGTGGSGNTDMQVWFDMGEEFLESNRGSQYKEAEEMLQKFAHEVKIENTKKELKAAEKKLKSLGNDIKSLTRQNENYHKNIENYERRIEEAKENIANNEAQQEDANKKIGLQELLIDEIDRRLRELKKH